MLFAPGCAWRWSRGGRSWQHRTHSRGGNSADVATCWYANDRAFMPRLWLPATQVLPPDRSPECREENHAASILDASLPLPVRSMRSGRAELVSCAAYVGLDFRHEASTDTKVILHGSPSRPEARRGSGGDPHESVSVLPNARSRARTPHDQVAQWRTPVPSCRPGRLVGSMRERF